MHFKGTPLICCHGEKFKRAANRNRLRYHKMILMPQEHWVEKIKFFENVFVCASHDQTSGGVPLNDVDNAVLYHSRDWSRQEYWTIKFI